jgi:hypothetical protein
MRTRLVIARFVMFHGFVVMLGGADLGLSAYAFRLVVALAQQTHNDRVG